MKIKPLITHCTVLLLVSMPSSAFASNVVTPSTDHDKIHKSLNDLNYLSQHLGGSIDDLQLRVDHNRDAINTNAAAIDILSQSAHHMAMDLDDNKKQIENRLENDTKATEIKLEDVYNRSKTETISRVDTLRSHHDDSLNTLRHNLYKEIGQTNSQLDQKVRNLRDQFSDDMTQLDNRHNHRLDQLKNKIAANAKQANSGIASVAAMSNIPYALHTRFSAGVGMGHYKNGKAIAAGAQYQIRKNVNLRSSIAWNNSNSPVIGAGVAVGW
ncbi:YadA-like family protein [Providencia rettgeri]|uniref:YadA-like family protein n=1 Tax=Providencia rettgeri TaxID=587 RepID=UPI0034E0B20D